MLFSFRDAQIARLYKTMFIKLLILLIRSMVT